MGRQVSHCRSWLVVSHSASHWRTLARWHATAVALLGACGWLCDGFVPATAEVTHGRARWLPRSLIVAAARGGDSEEVGTIKPLTKLLAGDRFTGWLKHPVLTKAQKFSLIIEVGPGDDEGTWRITPPTGTRRMMAFEGSYEVKPGSGPAGLLLRDEDTVLNATLNGAGPGTLSGRVVQCGLSWGGFFEASLVKYDE
mmetsp:Transcript_32432/g.75361  ORF Transcript_32432/g.75361 Transcript_32432/m.75361 type:complete len:197 (-) Transcript_32432:86-676(-)|eukprot:CAMPEP_0171095276 /NCGR_PEP_ID=MMETSP0766_2-20121228/43083_1 /TAXON_ID=439317 /ORGANISM="Gambierdiscus australes, Strain CAWD 149" /LENGTH=196 /DNA_ID=CAMNT_0011554067 /DNA_START=42 /DNA_END=632 /DNA_ORIENTATION=+